MYATPSVIAFILISPLKSALAESSLDDLPGCDEVLGDAEPVSAICKNNATCKARIHENYLDVYCDCSKLKNNTHYFVGKYCEIEVPHPVISAKDVNQTLNTCFIEDLLGINEWKNNFSVFGKIVR